VIACFVYIGGIEYHYCLNILFFMKFIINYVTFGSGF